MLMFLAVGGKANLGDSFYRKRFFQSYSSRLFMAKSVPGSEPTFPKHVEEVWISTHSSGVKDIPPSLFSLHSSKFLFWALVLPGSCSCISVNPRTPFSPDVSFRRLRACIFPGWWGSGGLCLLRCPLFLPSHSTTAVSQEFLTGSCAAEISMRLSEALSLRSHPMSGSKGFGWRVI